MAAKSPARGMARLDEPNASGVLEVSPWMVQPIAAEARLKTARVVLPAPV